MSEENNKGICYPLKIVKLARIRENAKLPIKSHTWDVGLDFYFNSQVELDKNEIILNPGQGYLFGTGIKAEIPDGFMWEVKNRSGMASKKDLVVGACVCDPRYSGEIFINLHNIGNNTQVIKEGDKIAQLVLIPIMYCDIEEVEEKDLYSYSKSDDRGEKGFGSSDKINLS
jgi:dUTP pyrophosphatase